MQRYTMQLHIHTDVTIEATDSVQRLPGIQHSEIGLGQFRFGHKRRQLEAAIAALETSDYFSKHRYLHATQLVLQGETATKIEHKFCPSCGGNGKQKCKRCSGSGHIACPRCGGQDPQKTSYTTHTVRTPTPCPNPRCNGGFETVFTHDNAHTRTCGVCSGTGRLMTDTYKQEHTAYKVSTCSSCDQHGQAKCPECRRGISGTCEACKGEKRITEVYSVGVRANALERVIAPKPFRRFAMRMAESMRNHPRQIGRYTVRRKGHRFNVFTEFDLEVGPVRYRQADGIVGDYDPWSVKDFRSGEHWHCPPSLWERGISFIGLGPTPPFEAIKRFV